MQGRNDSEVLFVASCHRLLHSCIAHCSRSFVSESCLQTNIDDFFFSPSTGVVAVSDPRGPAADPPGPGLGASRGGALCGAGGLLTQQVGGLTPGQSSLSLILFHSTFHCLLAIFIPLSHFTPLSFFVVCMSLFVSCIVPPQCPQKHDDRCWISSLCRRIKQEEVEEKAAQHARGKVMLYRWLFIHTLWFKT